MLSGSTLPYRVGTEVLHIVRDERLQENARDVGTTWSRFFASFSRDFGSWPAGVGREEERIAGATPPGRRPPRARRIGSLRESEEVGSAPRRCDQGRAA